jgi:hypothetical protein
MTMDRYSHVSTELQRDEAARLDAALDGAREGGRDQDVTTDSETG